MSKWKRIVIAVSAVATLTGGGVAYHTWDAAQQQQAVQRAAQQAQKAVDDGTRQADNNLSNQLNDPCSAASRTLDPGGC